MAGGYQAPANPAPVSGPGALSARTDGGPSQPTMQLADPQQYGDQAASMAAQQAAPMYAEPPVAPPPGLMDPTNRPDEPVTTGAPVGPGANALVGQSKVYDKDMQAIAKYIPHFVAMSAQDDTPESFRLFVRYLQGYA